MLAGLNTNNKTRLGANSVRKEVFAELVQFKVIVSVGFLFGTVGTVEEEAFSIEDY